MAEDLNTQLPWLMLVDSPTNSYRRYYSLFDLKTRKIHLPTLDEDAEDHHRYLSSQGWLISVSRKRALIHFFDVFSYHLIKPPSVPILLLQDGDLWDEIDESYLIQFSKFIFSTKPMPSVSSSSSSSPSEDFEVAMVFDIVKHIAFWRPAQEEWIKPVADFDIRQIEDVCFFRGEFYSIDHYSQVIAYGNQNPKKARIVANLESQGLVTFIPIKFYIVGSQKTSTLLVIHREVLLSPDEKSDEYWTEYFELFEVDVYNGKAKQVESIGDRALFVGYNSTFFVEACSSEKHGCRPNCIYFTDDNYEYYCRANSHRGGGSDMGIFSLEEKKVVDRFYEGPSQFDYETPPIWVEFPHSDITCDNK